MAKKTRKKAASRPKASKRASRDRYAHAEKEIVALIIAPRIQGLWNEGHRTPAALRTAYNDRFTTGHGDVSEAAFKGWLTACGFTRQPSTLSAPEAGIPSPHPSLRMTREAVEENNPAPRRNGRVDSLLRHDGDLDQEEPTIGNGPLEPMLTPPPEALPGDPNYVLSNPHA